MLTLALPTDYNQPMQINADSTLFNYKTGTSTYEGHVQVQQGTMHLSADRLVTRNNAQHKLSEAIAYGSKKLASYATLPKYGDQLFTAQARIIKYYPLQSIVILQKEVEVIQGKNSFQGPLIIYNIKDQIVSSPAAKNNRVKLILETKQMPS